MGRALDGEHVYPLTGLRLPAPDGGVERLLASEAGQLFAQRARAARLLGLAAGRLAAFGIVRPVPEQRFYDDELARLKAGMDPEALALAWKAGEAPGFEQAAAEALRETAPQAA